MPAGESVDSNLTFMPGKKEKKPDLTSPLLKHPRIYFAACLVVFLIGRWLLLHYDFVL